jgi:2'-5' RNA ligase
MGAAIRLFIAIELPESVTTALRKLSEYFPGLRIMPSTTAHLTIKFLGEMDDSLLPGLIKSLNRVKANSFYLKCNRLGTFKTGPGQVLWVGLEPNPELTTLFQSIEACLQEDLEIKPDKRKFSPHITLARVKTFARDLDIKATEFQGHLPPPFKIDCFGLYRSELTKSRAVHTLVSGFNLSL